MGREEELDMTIITGFDTSHITMELLDTIIAESAQSTLACMEAQLPPETAACQILGTFANLAGREFMEYAIHETFNGEVPVTNSADEILNALSQCGPYGIAYYGTVYDVGADTFLEELVGANLDSLTNSTIDTGMIICVYNAQNKSILLIMPYESGSSAVAFRISHVLNLIDVVIATAGKFAKQNESVGTSADAGESCESSTGKVIH